MPLSLFAGSHRGFSVYFYESLDHTLTNISPLSLLFFVATFDAPQVGILQRFSIGFGSESLVYYDVSGIINISN